MDAEGKEHLPLSRLSSGYLSYDLGRSALSGCQASVIGVHNDWVASSTLSRASGYEVDSRHSIGNPVNTESKLANRVVIVPSIDVPAVRRD
jgi:hypothetical protein